MSAPVDLATLAADAARWPADWTPVIDDDGEWTGMFLAVDRHVRWSVIPLLSCVVIGNLPVHFARWFMLMFALLLVGSAGEAMEG